MAAVTSSNVTRISGYESGDRYGNRVEDVKIFDVVLSANGGTADDIPATLFGFTSFNWAEVVRAIDGSSALAWVSVMVEADGAGILVSDPENATDATRGNPSNYTGTVRIRMGGV